MLHQELKQREKDLLTKKKSLQKCKEECKEEVKEEVPETGLSLEVLAAAEDLG